MYDVYMSEEEFINLKSGDKVTVRQSTDLIHDFGKDIEIPFGWNSEMDSFFGKELTVRNIDFSEFQNDYYIQVAESHWSFGKEMLEPSLPVISDEELSEAWKTMILGGAK